MNEDLRDRTLHNLTLHPPTSERAGFHMDGVRQAAKEFALAICAECPPSRELSLAVTLLEEASMWAIAAIARNQ